MFTDKLRQVKDDAQRQLEELAGIGQWDARKLEAASHLSTVVKNLCRIEEMDMQRSGRGYSGDGSWVAYGDYARAHPMMGNIYGDHPYVGDGNSYGYDGDTSGRRHYVRGHYSRAGAEEMLEEQMRNATDPAEREKLRRALNDLRS